MILVETLSTKKIKKSNTYSLNKFTQLKLGLLKIQEGKLLLVNALNKNLNVKFTKLIL